MATVKWVNSVLWAHRRLLMLPAGILGAPQKNRPFYFHLAFQILLWAPVESSDPDATPIYLGSAWVVSTSKPPKYSAPLILTLRCLCAVTGAVSTCVYVSGLSRVLHLIFFPVKVPCAVTQQKSASRNVLLCLYAALVPKVLSEAATGSSIGLAVSKEQGKTCFLEC